MTTIAYKDGILVADRLVTDNGFVWSRDAVKAKRIGDLLCAVAGDACAGEQFFAWVEGGMQGECPKPKSDDQHHQFWTIDAAGVITEYDPQGGLAKKPPFAAIGSGAKFALGAMAAGKSAREAVQIAGQFDVYTGSDLTILTLWSLSYE